MSYPCECHAISSLTKSNLDRRALQLMYFRQKPFRMSLHFAGPRVPAHRRLWSNLCRAPGWACPWKMGYRVICTDRAAFLPMWWELLVTTFPKRVTPIIRSKTQVLPPAERRIPVPMSAQGPPCHAVKATAIAATCFNIKTRSQIQTSRGSMLTIPNAI